MTFANMFYIGIALLAALFALLFALEKSNTRAERRAAEKKNTSDSG